ncbi:phosphoheptose isomerase family protein [Parenemella sanctibonifatiensis]|uniref:Uncharacterized protein n=1 Tax=Parenemella sanctibonifatiensis TaxID=2016505 RepID=A0A255E8H6_9ACTN|nr:SIS domain-containing protein [Parenemella sanctibonifatiensis]OYN87859.1 hypothetical protein CGZ92_06260 [Parenemella sanctibonifatiensis]
MPDFDDARLADPQALLSNDDRLRWIASAGARIRVGAEAAQDALRELSIDWTPRAILVIGAEARFVRAVLEPVCPVPMVAWSAATLPGWVGPLDLVVVLGCGDEQALLPAVAEATRRGSRVLLSSPEDSALVGATSQRATTWLPSDGEDPVSAAVVMLAGLHRLQLGPAVDLAAAADAVDAVAGACGPGVDLVGNPAKELAYELADAQPLVWGGSVLAARASRRFAEALREASGRAALAADATALVPVIDAVEPVDVFADPFADPVPQARPVLVLMSDGAPDPHGVEVMLRRRAEAREVRVSLVQHDTGSVGGDRGEAGSVQRYLCLLSAGLFAAAYLATGLGVTLDEH